MYSNKKTRKMGKTHHFTWKQMVFYGSLLAPCWKIVFFWGGFTVYFVNLVK